jgi:pSer/pThr/pTyr-binding forkhead associated (FHA) protein
VAVTFQLLSGNRVTIDADRISVGGDKHCQLCLSDDRVQPQHARIHKIAGRWIVESQGDWLVQVNEGQPGRKSWLKPGDVIRLSQLGPEIVFEPAE